jgi:hypothetical protein
MANTIPLFIYISIKNQIMNKLPIYKAIVGDDVETGMITISLVDAPAVEVDFLYFDEDKKPLSFAVEDEEQRKVLGVVMTCDSPIYRRDSNGYEYYIVYDRQTIEKMAEKYLRQNKQNNVDLNHSFVLEEGIYLNEFFIKDTAKGINPTGFEEVKDGSLFAIFHVQNDEVWNAIKEGTFKGFSLSGYFDSELVQFNKVKEDNKFMTKLKKIKAVLRNLLVEMGEVSTDKGILVWDGDEDIKVGDAVKGIDEEGNDIEVADGDYTTEDGKVIVVAEGKVTEIKEPEEMPAEEPTEEEKPVEAEGEPTEEPTEPVEDEKDAKIKALEEEIKAKDAEIEELKAKIAELENEPAAKPAEEEFAKAEAKEDNTPKGKMAKRGYKFSK